MEFKQTRMMKQDHHHHLNSTNKERCFSLVRATAFLLFFSLGYLFGSLSTSTSKQSPSPPQQHLLLPFPPLAVDATQPPPHDLFKFRTECSPPVLNREIIPTLLKFIYNNTSPYLNFPPPHVAPFLYRRRVRGWGSTTPVFEQLINTVKPRTIIEVGTFLGASALHMANITRRVGLADTVILCLDDFRGWPGFRDLNRGMFRHLVDVNGDVVLMQQFMQNVVDAGEEGRLLPVPFSTAAALAVLCEWGVYGDLVEVDAGHDFHSAWMDINMAWAVVRPGGGVMFGHDYNLAADGRGVRRAVDLFAKVKGLRVEVNGQHWVISTPKPPLASSLLPQQQ